MSSSFIHTCTPAAGSYVSEGALSVVSESMCNTAVRSSPAGHQTLAAMASASSTAAAALERKPVRVARLLQWESANEARRETSRRRRRRRRRMRGQAMRRRLSVLADAGPLHRRRRREPAWKDLPVGAAAGLPDPPPFELHLLLLLRSHQIRAVENAGEAIRPLVGDAHRRPALRAYQTPASRLFLLLLWHPPSPVGLLSLAIPPPPPLSISALSTNPPGQSESEGIRLRWFLASRDPSQTHKPSFPSDPCASTVVAAIYHLTLQPNSIIALHQTKRSLSLSLSVPVSRTEFAFAPN